MTTKTTTLTIDGTEITEGSTITLYNGNKVVRRNLTITHVEPHDDEWYYVTAKTTKGTTFWVDVDVDGCLFLTHALCSIKRYSYRRGTHNTNIKASHITPA